jgi:hypothetical protein
MQYNPQYSTLVVRNVDGSGYLRQFKTLSEAKEAYAQISASGTSVYLYQPPTKSLASFEAGSNVPDYDNGVTYGTGDKVKFQGKIYQLNNFIGAAGYTPASHPDQWTEVTSFTPPNIPPISSTGSVVIEDGVSRNPFTFLQEDNEVLLKMSKVGCVIGRIKDADNQEVFAPVYPRYIFQENGVTVDEKLGDINTNGCYYPNGFKISFTGAQDIFFSVQTLNSLDYGGTIYGPYYEVVSLLGYSRSYEVANGDGTTSVIPTIGIPRKGQQDDTVIDWEFYQNGDTPYSASGNLDFGNWTKIGQPVPNGSYLVTYRVPQDDKIHSGYWIASIVNAETSPKVKWVFEPVEPDQPPPPPCSITRKVRNPVSGNVDDECDPDVVYPFSVEENCEPPVTAQIEGQTVTLGTNIKRGMDNGYGDVVWGPCSGMTYIPNGVKVLQGASLAYFSDGQGSYYSEGSNPCTPSGTIISENRTDITADINGTAYTVGYSYERTVADGNCGTELELGSVYSPNGTFITETDDYRYYSNGVGGVYSTEICKESGTQISYSSKTRQLYISEIDSSVNIGTYTEYVYADGTCGTYTSDSDTEYYSSGTQIASNSSYNFFSNGGGGYYSEPKSCPPYGEYVTSGFGGYITVYISELNSSYNAGSSTVVTYADGNCGTYTETNNNWDSYGTLITSDSSYNYYSNGNGGYYAESTGGGTNCDSAGTWLEGSNSDITVNSPCGGNWTVGQSTYSVYADGNCGSYSESGNNYYSSDTFLGNCNDYNYYSDGNGSYRQGEYTGSTSYPSYGQPTGVGGSGTNYIDINGTQYENGSYSYTEYHDGMGGYYTDSSTSYSSYGTYFGSQSYYDMETLSDVYTYYYSDGNGGYYTSY